MQTQTKSQMTDMIYFANLKTQPFSIWNKIQLTFIDNNKLLVDYQYIIIRY